MPRTRSLVRKLRPNHPRRDLEGDYRPGNGDILVLWVLGCQGGFSAIYFGCRSNDSGGPIEAYPPQVRPVLVIVINKQTGRWILPDVLKPTEIQGRLRL